MKAFNFSLLILCMSGLFIFTSCEKEEEESHNHADCCTDTGECCHDNGTAARMAMVEDGYTEVEVNAIVKEDCYFVDWDKTVSTPVSGLFEYYDSNGNWAASIDFGDGSCDEWATKTWDVNMFPDHPEGSETFSVFKVKKDDKYDKE